MVVENPAFSVICQGWCFNKMLCYRAYISGFYLVCSAKMDIGLLTEVLSYSVFNFNPLLFITYDLPVDHDYTAYSDEMARTQIIIQVEGP